MNAAAVIALCGFTGGLFGLALHEVLKKFQTASKQVNDDIAWARSVLRDPKENSETTRVPDAGGDRGLSVAGDGVSHDGAPSPGADQVREAEADVLAGQVNDAFGYPVGDIYPHAVYTQRAEVAEPEPFTVVDVKSFAQHHADGLLLARQLGHFEPGRAEAFAQGWAHARAG